MRVLSVLYGLLAVLILAVFFVSPAITGFVADEGGPELGVSYVTNRAMVCSENIGDNQEFIHTSGNLNCGGDIASFGENSSLDCNGARFATTAAFAFTVTDRNVTIKNCNINAGLYGVALQGGELTVQDSFFGDLGAGTSDLLVQGGNITLNSSGFADGCIFNNALSDIHFDIVGGTNYPCGVITLQTGGISGTISNSIILGSTFGNGGPFIFNNASSPGGITISVNDSIIFNSGFAAITLSGSASNNTIINPQAYTTTTQITDTSSGTNTLMFNNSYGRIYETSTNVGLTTFTPSQDILITNNSVFVNSSVSSLGGWTSTVEIYSPGVSGGVSPFVNGTLCTAPRCTNFNDSLGPSTYSFDVTGFTTYSINTTPLTCGSAISSDYTMSEDLVNCTNDYIINITGAGTTFDCANYHINGSGNYGIAVLANNVTLNNCNVTITGVSQYALYTQANNTLVSNSSFYSSSIRTIFSSSSTENLTLNGITVSGGADTVEIDGINSFIYNSHIVGADGSLTVDGSNLYVNNTNISSGTTVIAIDVNAPNFQLRNANVSGGQYAVAYDFAVVNAVIENSVLSNQQASQPVIFIDGADNNNFTELTITAQGNGGVGISLPAGEGDTPGGNIFRNITIVADTPIVDSSGESNTFMYSNVFGSINWSGLNLDIDANISFSNYSIGNGSANISYLPSGSSFSRFNISFFNFNASADTTIFRNGVNCTTSCGTLNVTNALSVVWFSANATGNYSIQNPDTTAPVVTITAPEDNDKIETETFTLSVSVSETSTVEYRIDSGSYNSCFSSATSGSCTVNNLIDGEPNLITVRATDASDNFGTSSITVLVDISSSSSSSSGGGGGGTVVTQPGEDDEEADDDSDEVDEEDSSSQNNDEDDEESTMIVTIEADEESEVSITDEIIITSGDDDDEAVEVTFTIASFEESNDDVVLTITVDDQDVAVELSTQEFTSVDIDNDGYYDVQVQVERDVSGNPKRDDNGDLVFLVKNIVADVERSSQDALVDSAAPVARDEAPTQEIVASEVNLATEIYFVFGFVILIGLASLFLYKFRHAKA